VAELVRLAEDQLELLAELVAERLADTQSTPDVGLVDARTLAARLGVARDFVYSHAGELGAVRLGEGPRARLRFDVERAAAALESCSAGRGSQPAESAVVGPVRHRRRASRSGSSARLLPIRGVDHA
jgi:hypothetical protein